MKTLLLLVTLLCMSTASAQPLASPAADSNVAQLAPRIEHHGGAAYLAYIENKFGMNGDIMFAMRPASEGSFPAARRVTYTGRINASLQRGPEFVVAPNGTIHMVWMEERFKANADIFYTQSTDGGSSWSAPFDLSRDGQLATQDFPSIATDSAGNVYVVWIDNREIVAGKSKNDHIYLTRSFDGGANWDAPKKAEQNPGNIGGSCECCRTSIAASTDGDLYIAYRTNMDHVRDIFVARSNDKGETFDTSIRVQTKEWIVHACPATGPSVALDHHENLHVVYRSAANANKAVVFYNLLPKGQSRTFTEMPLTPVSGSSANYPDITVTDSGALSVVYQMSGKIYERTSGYGGALWTDAARIDTAETGQSFPAISSAEGETLVLWQDDRRDMSDVIGLEREFDPELALPSIERFDRSIEGDSIRLSWVTASPRAMTWYEIWTKDATIITYDTALTLPRRIHDRSEIVLTPYRSIGGGRSESFAQLGVKREDAPTTLSVSKQPVYPGDRFVVALGHPNALSWRIYDVQGKAHGSAISVPASGQQEIELPQLAPGVYHLLCDEPLSVIKLVVVAR